MKKNIFALFIIINIIIANLIAFASVELTKDYMILNAEPNFIEHTIEWDGEIYLYD